MGKKRRITIAAGTCVEVIEYTPPNRHDAPRQRAAKSKASSEARKQKNKAMSRKNLKFILAANFIAHRDYVCGLDFDAEHEPQSRAACEAALEKFIRRLRDKRNKRGQSLKWVAVIERKHMKGRWHIHLVINAGFSNWSTDLDELISLWGRGGVDLDRLFTGKYRNDSWAKLASYLSKERPEGDPEQNKPWVQSYRSSHNLDRPKAISEWVDVNDCFDIPRITLAETAEQNRVETLFSVFNYYVYELPH
ncbi:MAG: hypothetical protein IJO40_04495 [Thermoguttaceae bacterium]|nr:hypothetical protein [Thermoguttaceae bacterium]